MLEIIINHLHGNDKVCCLPVLHSSRAVISGVGQSKLCMGVQSHLALCCKATLPILCMGHVTINTDKKQLEQPLLQATRRLIKQPSVVTHLEVWSRSSSCGNVRFIVSTHHLIDLRCAMLSHAPTHASIHEYALLLLCQTRDGTHAVTDGDAALCFSRLLSNLRNLTLGRVAISLPALQQVATQLHELNVSDSHLQGSADGFLTKGWTALTSLSLTHTFMENATLTAALQLPALEDVHICMFTGHQGGELQLDQLTGSCPHVSRMEFHLSNRFHQATEASRQSCGLLNLDRLADLHIKMSPLQANLDLDLPPSLTQLKFEGYPGGNTKSVDFSWALREAVKCVGRGAQLHRLICSCAEVYLPQAQWGASLDKRHRRLGGLLGCLRELEVWGNQEDVLSAVGAVASAAPSLVRLEIIATDASHVEVSPICSASLESIRVEQRSPQRPMRLPAHVKLTLLPGCTRLQEVVVHFPGTPVKGAGVAIRCHCCSRRCIVPEEVHAGDHSDVVVKFLHLPSSQQGVQECTILFAVQPAWHEQAPLWGHAVMPGIL